MPHMGALYSFAARMTGNTDDAHDLVQETYLKAWRFWDKFEPGTNCKAWLFRIMKNSYINLYRKEVKEPDKVDFDDVKEFLHSIRGSTVESTDATRCSAVPIRRAAPTKPVVHGSSSRRLRWPNHDGSSDIPSNDGPASAE